MPKLKLWDTILKSRSNTKKDYIIMKIFTLSDFILTAMIIFNILLAFAIEHFTNDFSLTGRIIFFVMLPTSLVSIYASYLYYKLPKDQKRAVRNKNYRRISPYAINMIFIYCNFLAFYFIADDCNISSFHFLIYTIYIGLFITAICIIVFISKIIINLVKFISRLLKSKLKKD